MGLSPGEEGEVPMKNLPLVVAVLLAASPLSASAESRELSQGEAAVHEFQIVAADSQVVVTLAWEDRATEWNLSLRSANGVMVTGSVPGVQIEKGPFSYRLLIDRRSAPQLGWEGTWAVRLRLLATHRKRPIVRYTFNLGAGGKPVEVRLKGLGGVQRTGDRVELQAIVRPGGDREATVDAVVASVVPRKGGEPFEVALRDDGEDADREAGDGTWSAGFTWPEPGKYRVSVAVEGRDASGRSFREGASSDVNVRKARKDLP
jgi:hypothetical protein